MKEPIGFKMALDDETVKMNRTRKKSENYEPTHLKFSESQNLRKRLLKFVTA